VAGPENVDSGNVEQMTENTPMTNTMEKTGGSKIFRLYTANFFMSWLLIFFVYTGVRNGNTVL
jgi:hypothetical protein